MPLFLAISLNFNSATPLPLGKVNSFNVFGNIYVDEEDLNHEDEQVGQDNVALQNSVLKENPVSQVPSHHDAGISAIEKWFDPVEDAVAEPKESHSVLDIGM